MRKQMERGHRLVVGNALIHRAAAVGQKRMLRTHAG